MYFEDIFIEMGFFKENLKKEKEKNRSVLFSPIPDF